MNLLIKSATVIHSNSPYHGQTVDIHIENGIIKAIDQVLNIKGASIITGQKLYCTIGLCDIGTHTGEPGNENRETIDSLCKSAKSGGYTQLAVFPNNKPVTQSRAHIRYLKEHPGRQGVHLSVIGALSKDLKGGDIAEYMDMHAEGVVAFSDGLHSVENTGLIGRALMYASTIGVPIIHRPDDVHLSSGGEMHEGDMSTSLGMKGIPNISEINIIHRDILLQSYNGGHIIEHGLSVADSVTMIENAKNKSQDIDSTVSYMNLLWTDQDLYDFDSNLKVLPVLRSENDRKALIDGIKKGVISAIISNHTPLDEESKNLEFPYATPGAIGLETCFAATVDGLKDEMPLETIIDRMTVGPRKILGIDIPEIKVGSAAELCVFDTENPWNYEMKDIVSKSKNSPYIGKQFTTKVIATIC